MKVLQDQEREVEQCRLHSFLSRAASAGFSQSRVLLAEAWLQFGSVSGGGNTARQ